MWSVNLDGYLLGIDLGSSSVKATLVDVRSGVSLASSQSPAEEMSMVSVQPGWAEQDPLEWWRHVVTSVKACLVKSNVSHPGIKAIGISYQMHGLVLVGKDMELLRPSIIWCDSRAVSIGENAFDKLGKEFCLKHYLNSPGNFTASKLRWVRENEPDLYDRIYKIMLPGEYIALKLTGEICTTTSGLSEGIFWDFESQGLAQDILRTYDIDEQLLPVRTEVFSVQGKLTRQAAMELGLSPGVAISYRAGDQPNNAFSLGVINPGETTATAGTSGVIYSVTDKNVFDPKSRVNTFVHVNNEKNKQRNGVLLCVNGTGILNRWLRQTLGERVQHFSYQKMNDLALETPIGADGLSFLPFGNGAERVLQNKLIGASLHGLDFNRHSQSHILRASQEGIVFALKYGFDILEEIGIKSKFIKAGYANMFLSPLFREAFVNTMQIPLELIETDGAKGAALGAGIGAGIYHSATEAFHGLRAMEQQNPDPVLTEKYLHSYSRWRKILNNYV